MGNMNTIYAYSTKTYFDDRIARGETPWLKVGMTAGAASRRVSQQDTTGIPEPLVLHKEWSVPFTDHEIHDALSRMGMRRTHARREWFECTVADVEKAIALLVADSFILAMSSPFVADLMQRALIPLVRAGFEMGLATGKEVGMRLGRTTCVGEARLLLVEEAGSYISDLGSDVNHEPIDQSGAHQIAASIRSKTAEILSRERQLTSYRVLVTASDKLRSLLPDEAQFEVHNEERTGDMKVAVKKGIEQSMKALWPGSNASDQAMADGVLGLQAAE